jgi:hypothetical protein
LKKKRITKKFNKNIKFLLQKENRFKRVRKKQLRNKSIFSYFNNILKKKIKKRIKIFFRKKIDYSFIFNIKNSFFNINNFFKNLKRSKNNNNLLFGRSRSLFLKKLKFKVGYIRL